MIRSRTYSDCLILEASGESLSNCLLVLFLDDPRRSGEDTIRSLSLSDIWSNAQLEKHAQQLRPCVVYDHKLTLDCISSRGGSKREMRRTVLCVLSCNFRDSIADLVPYCAISFVDERLEELPSYDGCLVLG